MSLTKELSDALCSVIATGFMRSTRQNFIYDNGDAKKHYQLEGILKSAGINVEFSMQACPKESQPFIAAVTARTTPTVLEGISEELRAVAANAEAKINALGTVPLRGAYVGAMDDYGKVEFVGPSDLYQYVGKFRESDPAIRKSYECAREVSNIVIGFMEEIKAGVSYWKTVRVSPTGKTEPITAPYEPGKLFGSVHGMTQAIAHYQTGISPAMICLELALGKDTCKVASCVPCSLFMTAQGTPASATHLGRGDNWNLPERIAPNNPCVSAWSGLVAGCYKAGLEILLGNKKVMELEAYMSAVSNSGRLLPDIFLEALTFESAFVDKMISTLG